MNNREIKFRAWDVKKKKWYEPTHRAHEGNLHELNLMLNGSWAIRTMDGTCHQSASDEEFVILQFTGLKDKNGKEIYEGDVVTWWDGDEPGEWNPRIAVVEFSPELAFRAMNVRSHDGKMGYKFSFGNFIYTDTEKHLEVIGNVFENPSLLK